MCGSYRRLEPPEITASGYVVKSLEAVLWAFYHTNNFKEGCLKVGKRNPDGLFLFSIFKSQIILCCLVCG